MQSGTVPSHFNRLPEPMHVSIFSSASTSLFSFSISKAPRHLKIPTDFGRHRNGLKSRVFTTDRLPAKYWFYAKIFVLNCFVSGEALIITQHGSLVVRFACTRLAPATCRKLAQMAVRQVVAVLSNLSPEKLFAAKSTCYSINPESYPLFRTS